MYRNDLSVFIFYNMSQLSDPKSTEIHLRKFFWAKSGIPITKS